MEGIEAAVGDNETIEYVSIQSESVLIEQNDVSIRRKDGFRQIL